MKFNLLLLILYVKLKQAAKRNIRFRKFIKDKNLRFGIKTADGKLGRLFVFSNGTITSRWGSPNEIDAAMVWSDADTAFKTMSNSNEEASLVALTEKKLEVEGDLKEFMWFSRGIDIMMGKA
jgi:hypothetical protein